MRKIDRREYLRITAGAVSGIAFSTTARADNGTKTSQPNIVFIIADDMGWADVGSHNPELITPNIDRLAKEGVRLTHHYAMPTCTPTRVGIMTGRYPSRFGVVSPAYGEVMPKDTNTLPSALSAAGYDTSISGKWHMGSPPEYTPLEYGFETSYGYLHGQVDPYTHLYKTGVRTWHRNDEFIEEEGHATDLISDEAVQVIKNSGQEPFFLYVAYSVPHFPLNEPQQWLDMYKDVENESRRWFNASVTHMDHGIGQIVDAVNQKGIRENTLIVFVSDNGGQKSWHNDKQYKGRYADKPHTVLGDNTPLRGWKGQVYEGGIRVPALVNWPGVLEPGEMDAPVHIVDWLPTLCQAARCERPQEPELDGRDVWALITGNASRMRPRTMYWKTPNASSVRHGDWKLVVHHKGDKPELYNLAKDPYEEKDLADAYPERVKELKDLLARLREDDRERE